MPAVKIFSLSAALAVLFDFFLQMSLFVALLTLDAKREMVREKAGSVPLDNLVINCPPQLVVRRFTDA